MNLNFSGARPSATPFWLLPVSQRAHPVDPFSGQPGHFVNRGSRPLRGIGFADVTGGCPDAFGNDPCAPGGALYQLPLSTALTSLPETITRLQLQAGISNANPLMMTYAGLPGWGWLAIAGGGLFLLASMGGGRRR